MPSTLHLACADLAALVKRGLGNRVRTVGCVIDKGALRFSLDKLDLAGWLPRLKLEIAVDATLQTERQEITLRWKVLPSSIIGFIAGPIQHLGAGTKVIDAIIERLGWRDAVINRGDDAMILSLQHLAPLRRLGIHVRSLDIAEELRVELSLEQAEGRS